ncbi:Putative cytochrome b5-like heme/steroid binding domain, myosin head, motor domain, chitin synthase [Septoria linicola]|uniref:chitin synthase n=1 Tax=Septoria linicola TaxID=215465 RepID=A0A9Q9AZ69_9PEZI|nr:putative cytochrome b5-like heme/steroid binding domain, myosin head, motor domain, chitin synthase [Septoria linicola]USW53351.1 Putative cytochrome b5-like heme/steroid binding domain, myosin head, motor domain, chitin synthase [Septoria linicola]
MANNQQQNLAALPAHSMSDTNITSHIASRFHQHLPITTLSSQGYIAVNTYNSAAKGPNGGKEGSAMGAAEELASRMWTRLGTRQENQAAIFLGESGTGKTTIRSHVLSNLLQYSSTPLSKKLSFAAFVFDSLTTTKSITTPTASKAGLFFELQYDTNSSIHPTLIGGKVLDHRLERSRVAMVPPGERNFHILYYLLAGTSPAEKEHLGLDLNGGIASGVANRTSVGNGLKRWRYLGHPSQLKVGINDAEGFQHFKTALRKLEFPREEIAHMCEVLAAILHIGQLEFMTSQSTTPAPDESGGYGAEGGEEITVVKNKETLVTIAAFLGVSERTLEQSLGYRTKILHRERVTVMLDPKGARENADELARTLYSLLVALVMEKINQRVCAIEDQVANTIAIVDFPGFAQASSTGSVLDQLLTNAANESLYNFCLQSFFERKAELLETEEVQVPATSYFDNSDAVKGLLKAGNGVLGILDDQMRRGKTDLQLLESLHRRFNGKNPAIEVASPTVVLPGTNFQTPNQHPKFTVKHFAGEVEYPVDGLLEENGEVISGDLMNLVSSTSSSFVSELFGQEALNKTLHPHDRNAVTQASVASKPSRMPSTVRRKGSRPARLQQRDEDASDEGGRTKSFSRSNNGPSDAQQGAAAQFLASLDIINRALTAPNTNPYFFFCLKPNDRRIANQFDSKCVRTQIQVLGIAEIGQRLKNADFSIFMPFTEFLGAAEGEVSIVGSDREKAELILDDKSWPNNEAKVGTTGVFLSERCWRQITNAPELGEVPPSAPYGDDSYANSGMLTPDAKRGFGDSKVHLLQTPGSGYLDDKAAGYFGSRDMDAKSEAGASAFREGDMFRNLETRSQMAEKGNEIKAAEIEERPASGSRVRWLVMVYFFTWWCPDFLIRTVGRMPRKDVRMAWREKLAINMMIWLSCAFVVFFMIGFPALICPTQHVYSLEELTSYNGKDDNSAYIAIRGVVFDLDAFMPAHYPSIVPQSALKKYAGTEATNLFPVQVSAMCQGQTEDGIDPAVQLSFVTYNYSGSTASVSAQDTNAQYHDFRWATNDSRPAWFIEQMIMLQGHYFKGHIGYSPQYLKTLADKQNYIAYINGRVYDFTDYIAGGRAPQYPPGTDRPSTAPDSNFMADVVVDLFQQRSGQDVTKYWDALNIDPGLRNRMETCMNNLFYVGDLDTRSSPQCQFAKYILLAISLLLVSVICFKFLAALQFGKKNVPENLDKFVIATVPAYTEDEESLRRAIDSAARMRYDDKRKLLFIICDGMIIGQGNDRPTPRIVLDILGVPETVDPEPLSFESLGEGMKQHNMGKVYSGLYEVQGHIVPFIVIVKVGKPSEVSRPGNRGKRDSQMILMRFLNRVHYNLPMTPLELELHHQIRNVIGVNPTFYEFLLQIDADTVVAPDSATRFVSAFVNDTKLIAVCGETALTNAKASFITMMQVYEYYISHNLTKAFESLFGSVTCLPGCFTMYRIRAAETGKPLFVSREIVNDYSEVRVDTLHMKNLLHLGEDRYLTTLLMKYHSKYKTKYIMRAHAWTIAPDSWAVFMSQRRRWINSTVHNLIEVIPLQQLCGFCCFSMRFVVFLDLLSTIVQPVIVGYIVYLIVTVAKNPSTVPVTAFILLGAIYGLQAIIFIVRRKWEMVGWMIIYMLATPIFSFALPLIAFWNMDDFSWGNTRMVTGEKGKQIIVSDEGKFDPDSIPKKKWEEYQAELWDAQTQRDDARSEISGISYATKSWHPAASEYGYQQQAHMSQLSVPGMHPNASHMSLAYSDNGMPMGARSDYGDISSDIPSDDAILAEIREILRTADLMSVTKKSIKAELERRFQVPMDSKRQYIGSATEAILSGQL